MGLVWFGEDKQLGLGDTEFEVWLAVHPDGNLM